MVDQSHKVSSNLLKPTLEAAQAALERAGAKEYELFFSQSQSTKISSRNQKVDALKKSEDVGLAIRVKKGNQAGFSYTTSLARDSIEKACKKAMEIAEVMPEDENFAFPQQIRSSDYQPTLDQEGLAVPIEEKIQRAIALESETKSKDSRITGVRAASVGESFGRVALLRSSGELLESERSLFTASIDCKASEGEESQEWFEYGFSSTYRDLDTSHIATQASRFVTELLGSKPGPTLQCPAVFRNDAVVQLLDFLSSSFSAEQIDKGRSMLLGKEGSQIFSDQLTLIDDGLLQGGYGSSAFDGEGGPTQKTTLVDRGQFVSALYDTYYAHKAGKKSTGNSVRGISSPPGIGYHNLYLQKGDHSLDQLLSRAGDGVLLTHLMGVHTANSVTGDFSLGATGFLVKNGKISHPIRGIAVAGNILGLLKNVNAVGSDLRFFGDVGAPSLLFGEVSIGGGSA